jgi:adenosylcobinamide-phosphate synthase
MPRIIIVSFKVLPCYLNSMSFLALLTALLLAHYHQPPSWLQALNWHVALSRRLDHWLNDGQFRHGLIAWILAVLLPTIIISAIYYAALQSSSFLTWLVSVALLYVTLNGADFGDPAEAIAANLRDNKLDEARMQLAEWSGHATDSYDDASISRIAIETTLLRSHSGVFAPIFWFVLLGPAGAVLYRLAALTHQAWKLHDNAFNKTAQRVFFWLNWLPAHVSAISFAVAGNFEDAMYCWRTQADAWHERTQGMMLASGAGALGVRLGEPLQQPTGLEYRPELGLGDAADADYLMSSVGLIWRVLVLILALVLLLTFANWLGS